MDEQTIAKILAAINLMIYSVYGRYNKPIQRCRHLWEVIPQPLVPAQIQTT